MWQAGLACRGGGGGGVGSLVNCVVCDFSV